jgi:hypothetical protein
MDAAQAQGTANVITGVGQLGSTFATMAKDKEEQEKKDQAASIMHRNTYLRPSN